MAAFVSSIEQTTHFQLDSSNRKFNHAFAQVKLLTHKMTMLQCRYDRAIKNQQSRLITPIRMRMAVLEGVRAMFYSYAHDKALDVEEYQENLTKERA